MAEEFSFLLLGLRIGTKEGCWSKTIGYE